jgi:hypothetical protein
MTYLKHRMLTDFAAIDANFRKTINRAGFGNESQGHATHKNRARLGKSGHLGSLTGVKNRNRFHHHLEQMLQRGGAEYALLTYCNSWPRRAFRSTASLVREHRAFEED